VNVCPTGIDIRDGVQLSCINCGLCVDACNEIMTKAGRPKWLILWDTLARQDAKAQGRHEAIHLLRPRTLIYVTALLLATSVMGGALAMRSHVNLSVLHDRAPLFVKVRDGSIRNAYTLKVSNKTDMPASFSLVLGGLAGGAMALSDEAENRDAIGTFRVLVYGTPTRLADGSQKVGFTLRNTATGESTEVSSVFMGPAK
jgi:polyferredoxin